MTLACPKCRTFFRTRKVGIYWEEGMPTTNDRNGPWQPYKLWAGDLRECECGSQVIMGPPGGGPIAEHYQPGYADMVTSSGSIVRIDDCPGMFQPPEVGRVVIDEALVGSFNHTHIRDGKFAFTIPVSVGAGAGNLYVEPLTMGEREFMHLCKRIVKAIPDGWPFA